MTIKIIIQQDGKEGETSLDLLIGSNAWDLPAMQLQDAIAEMNVRLLDAVVNVAQQKDITDPELMGKISLKEIGPIGCEIKTTSIPNKSNNSLN